MMNQEQQKLIDDLWTIFYDNPLYDNDGEERNETSQQVIARALIAILTSIELPDSAEVPK